MDNDKNSFGDKLKKLTQKDGFYLVLFLCICIVGVTAVWVSSDNFNQIADLDDSGDDSDMNLAEDDNDIIDYYLENEESDDQQDPDTEDVDIEENTSEEGQIGDEPATTEEPEVAEESNEQTTNEEETVETVSTGARQLAMLVPIAGRKSMGFAKDNLIYSETLEQWTTHNGLDIQANKGSAVRAVLSGVVKEVETSDELGIVVTIDHGENLLTKYGCLSTDEMVSVGDLIDKGDPIGAVGEAVGYELAQGAHLHFEVLENGTNIDPTNYLPDFE